MKPEFPAPEPARNISIRVLASHSCRAHDLYKSEMSKHSQELKPRPLQSKWPSALGCVGGSPPPQENYGFPEHSDLFINLHVFSMYLECRSCLSFITWEAWGAGRAASAPPQGRWVGPSSLCPRRHLGSSLCRSGDHSDLAVASGRLTWKVLDPEGDFILPGPAPPRPCHGAVSCAVDGASGTAPHCRGRGETPAEGSVLIGATEKSGGPGDGGGSQRTPHLSQASRDGRLVLPGLNWTRARVALGRSRSQAGSREQGPEVPEVRGTLGEDRLSSGPASHAWGTRRPVWRGRRAPQKAPHSLALASRSPAPAPAPLALLVS